MFDGSGLRQAAMRCELVRPVAAPHGREWHGWLCRTLVAASAQRASKRSAGGEVAVRFGSEGTEDFGESMGFAVLSDRRCPVGFRSGWCRHAGSIQHKAQKPGRDNAGERDKPHFFSDLEILLRA